MATLRERYGPLLDLVRLLIGVVPKCDEYLEIWPPAFRTYNILVPSLLNLPFSLFGLGGAPVETVGLGMYVSSRVADCAYCSAHTCSFALRRGVSGEKIASTPPAPRRSGVHGLRAGDDPRGGCPGPGPTDLASQDRDHLRSDFNGRAESRWIVAGIAMMGFLNKWMDVIGVDLEATTAAEVEGTIGKIWLGRSAGRNLAPGTSASPPPRADSFWTKLRVVPLAPFALRKDKEWQRGTPDRWPAAGQALRGLTGHEFPVLSRLVHGRLIQGIGSILRDNLDPSTTVVGLEIKILAGIVFASVVGDRELGRDVRALCAKRGVDAATIDAVERFATTPDADPPTRVARDRAARSCSPRPRLRVPRRSTRRCVLACREGGVSAAAIVEVVTWLAVLQMLHRLGSYYVAA